MGKKYSSTVAEVEEAAPLGRAAAAGEGAIADIIVLKHRGVVGGDEALVVVVEAADLDGLLHDDVGMGGWCGEERGGKREQ